MAGTVTQTRTAINSNTSKIVFTWESTAGGAADLSFSVVGWLVKMVTDPSATAPTDDYDITIVDEYGVDALGGAGLNRDTANSEQIYPVGSSGQTPVFLCGTHTFTVANAGATKAGVCVLYVKDNL